MIRRCLVAAARVAAFVLLASAAQASTHPFDAHDLVAMDRLSSPAVSPDGKQVAFEVSTLDLAANTRHTHLWLVPMAGGEARPLTTDPASDSAPTWAPDGGSLYFLSARSGSSQVWRLPMDGGEALQVTHLPVDVETFRVSPDGKKLAVSLEVFVDCKTLDCTAERLQKRDDDKATGQLYHSLFVRHWDTWSDGRRSHLFVVPVTGGEAVDVTAGVDADTPSKPFGGNEEYAFSPDGRWIVYTAKVQAPREPWSTNFDLYKVPVQGGAAAVDLTAENQALDTQPVFSPDGKTLAYLAMSRPGFEADRLRIVLEDWASGAKRVLTEKWDRSVGSYLFSADGKSIYATADDLGNTALFGIDVASGNVRRLVTDGTVHGPQVAADGDVVYARDQMRSPIELFRFDPRTAKSERLTHFNDARLADIAFGEPEQFHFPGWHGETVYGWMVKPANFEPGKKYPLAFLVHGGPQGSWTNDFHYRWNPEIFAGAGYVALEIDFHGSTGYGQAFTDSISGDWGGKPLVDLQKGMAAALARYPFIDGDRACALGASYGGFMMNWIEGNWPDRFRCIVNHDGVFDQRMMYYATEELWFPEWEQGGPYWKNSKAYEKFNPVDFVDKWRTPMLVVHSLHDFRIPLSQGLGAFTALQRQGIPSEFLYFPDESHFVQKPANSILWHDTVLAWMQRWLGKDEGK